LILVIITSRDYQDERKGLKFSTIEASNGIYISLGAFFQQHSALERRNSMKRLTIFGIVACVGLLFAPAAVIGAGPPGGLDVNVVNTPLPVTVQPDGISVNVSTVYQFVGYAGPTEGAAGGIVGMHAICQAEFGELARMCTSKEFWTSPEAVGPLPLLLSAWIQPSIVGIWQNGTEAFAMDFTGARLRLDSLGLPTCHQWTTSAEQFDGTFIAEFGGSVVLSYDACVEPRLVTCCTPAHQ
jgi:hypothetical protein